MKRIIFLALTTLFTLNLCAQQNPEQGKPRFDPKEFQQRMEEALTRQAELTPEEAKVFFPIYKEMKEKQRNIGIQIHELKKQCKSDDASCAAAIAKIKHLSVESAQVEQTYYRRLMEAVPASKVFKVMKAEDDFHRRMVQGSRERQQRPFGFHQNWRKPQTQRPQ